MSDERNFRSTYYGKFGVTGIDEKKSIETLLKEQPLDKDKLQIFCQRCTIPAVYRLLVWKVLLGILPCNQTSQDFVLKQRTEQYDNLVEALRVMRRKDDETPVARLFYKMFLLESGSLPFEDHDLFFPLESQAFLCISNAVCEVTEDMVDRYWISKEFFKAFKKYQDYLPKMPEITIQCLKKEDQDSKLADLLIQCDIPSSLPLSRWFYCCYAGILPDNSFERIWDKVIGGSCLILVYVAVAIFLTYRRPLLSMKGTEEMIQYLRQLPPDSGETLVSNAIRLWQKNGSHLM